MEPEILRCERVKASPSPPKDETRCRQNRLENVLLYRARQRINRSVFLGKREIFKRAIGETSFRYKRRMILHEIPLYTMDVIIHNIDRKIRQRRQILEVA